MVVKKKIRNSPEALTEYRRRGWHVTEFGTVGISMTTGPCARCGGPCERYGERGRPLCTKCEPAIRHRGNTQVQ
jgi:hypothetical protein